MPQLAKFLPHNIQEFENDMRALIASHQGLGSGNPTQWVVDAVVEAFQRGFGLGFDAGTKAANTAPPPPPAYRVQIPPGHRLHREPPPETIEVPARELPYTPEN